MVELTDEIKREIGQHFVFGFHGHGLSEEIISLVRDYHLGNVILMKRNVRDVEQVHKIVLDLQHLAKKSGQTKPLLIGIDQENGLVSAFSSPNAGTQFPGAMTIAATGSLELAEKTSAASARELKLAGINWVYSPVADVNSDARNPVIGVRSFGDDPEEVSKYACTVAKAVSSKRVAPCPKHFAGHGDTHIDSHLALPRIEKDKAALEATELVPFKALIAAGVPTIMTGHMALPLLTNDETPCSLSKVLTDGLLRQELGFEGVIVTDCLEMDAVAEKYGSERGAVMSLQAGADVAMICHRFDRHKGAIEATYEAIRSGALNLDGLRRSGDRISKLKDEYAGTWQEVFEAKVDFGATGILKADNRRLSARAYAASTALIRDPHHAIPLPRGRALLILTPEMEKINAAVDNPEGLLVDKNGNLRNTAGPTYLSFVQALSRRLMTRHIVYGPRADLTPGVADSLHSGASLVFCTRNADRSTWQIDCLRSLIAHITTKANKVIVISTCAPYDLLNAKDLDVAHMATFEFTVPALEAAVAVLTGACTATGRVPVLKGDV